MIKKMKMSVWHLRLLGLIVEPRDAQVELSDSKQQNFDFALGHGRGTNLK